MKKFLLVFLVVTGSIFVASAQTMGIGNANNAKQSNLSIKYRGEASVGYAACSKANYMYGGDYSFASGLSRPMIETIHGAEFNDYFFAGVGLGVQFFPGRVEPSEDMDEKWNILAFPLFVNFKGFFPVNDSFKPFANFSLGGTLVASSALNETVTEYNIETKNRVRGGMFYDMGVGVQLNRVTFACGMQHQVNSLYSKEKNLNDKGDESEYMRKWDFNSLYIKVGITF